MMRHPHVHCSQVPSFQRQPAGAAVLRVHVSVCIVSAVRFYVYVSVFLRTIIVSFLHAFMDTGCLLGRVGPACGRD